MAVVVNPTVIGQPGGISTPINVTFPSTQAITIADTDDSIKIGNGSGVFADVTAARAIKVDGSGVYAVQTDQASATVLYVGKAAAGSATSAAAWQIRRITTTGSNLSVQHAGSTNAFTGIWDNRAGLSYG